MLQKPILVFEHKTVSLPRNLHEFDASGRQPGRRNKHVKIVLKPDQSDWLDDYMRQKVKEFRYVLLG
jgi:hypothetical protein